jgi:hypothetical protein
MALCQRVHRRNFDRPAFFDRLEPVAGPLAPDQTVEMPLSIIKDKDGTDLDKADEPVLVRIYWRRSGSMWLRRLPLSVNVKPGDITLMSAAEIGGED